MAARFLLEEYNEDNLPKREHKRTHWVKSLSLLSIITKETKTGRDMVVGAEGCAEGRIRSILKA